jgi:hypothetical protein
MWDTEPEVTRPHPRLVEVADFAVMSVLMKLLAACGVKEPIQKRCSTKDKQSRSEPFSHAHQRTVPWPMSAKKRSVPFCEMAGCLNAGIQFASQSVSSTKVKTKIAMPKIMSCPRMKFRRSAALILIIAPPEQIEM